MYVTIRRTIPEVIPGMGDIVIVCIVPMEIDEAKIRGAEKELDKLRELIRAKESKLDNENFLAHAPPEIIKKECESLWILETKYNDKRLLLNQWRQALANCPSESADSFDAVSKP